MMGLLLCAAAWADPVALRAPPAAAPTAVVGLHDLSVSAPWPGSTWEVALSLRADRGAADVAIGRRTNLAMGRQWRADAGWSGGVVVPLVVPSVGLAVTPWVSGGVVGERGTFQGVVALPVATSLVGGLRVPLLAELQGTVRIGPVSVGPRLAMGPVWTPGTDVSVATEGAVLLQYRTSSRTTARASQEGSWTLARR